MSATIFLTGSTEGTLPLIGSFIPQLPLAGGYGDDVTVVHNLPAGTIQVGAAVLLVVDVIDELGDPVDMAGWALSAIVRPVCWGDMGDKVINVTTAGGGIVAVIDPDTAPPTGDLSRLNITWTAAMTGALQGFTTYAYAVWRTDAGNEQPLVNGHFVPSAPAPFPSP